MYIENSIVIKGSVDKVFDVMADVERWHESFPHIYKKKAKILKKEKDKLLIERDGIIKWRSSIIIDKSNKLIKAEHLNGLTKGLIAIWKFEEIPEGTNMFAIHKFRNKISLIRFTKELIMLKIIEKTSNNTLEAIKRKIERGEQ